MTNYAFVKNVKSGITITLESSNMQLPGRFECTYVDKKYSVKNEDGKVAVAKDAPFVPEFTDIHINRVVCRNAKVAVKAYGLEGFDCVNGISIDNSTFFYTQKDKDLDANVRIDFGNTKFFTY